MKLKDLLPLIDRRHGVILVEEFSEEKYYKGETKKVPEKYLDYKVYNILGSYFEITIRISK